MPVDACLRTAVAPPQRFGTAGVVRHGDEDPHAAANEVVQHAQGRIVVAIQQRIEQQQLALDCHGVTRPAAELARTQPSRAALPAPDPSDDFLDIAAGHRPSYPSLPGSWSLPWPRRTRDPHSALQCPGSELSSRRQQIRQQARARKPSWMSSRRSVRMRSRRRLWSQAKVRSTTQRWRPSPEPCSVWRRAISGLTPRSPDEAAVLVVVVAAVGDQRPRSASRPADPAATGGTRSSSSSSG